MLHKRKVLMIAPRYAPASGGVEKHIQKITDIFLKRNFQIDILTCKHTPDLKTIERISENYRILRVPYKWDKNPFLVSIWIMKNRHQFGKYDIIHIHDTIPFFVYSIPFLVANANRRISITFHGFERDPIPLIFKILRKISRRVIKKAICIGKFIERDYNINCDICIIGATDSVIRTDPLKAGLVYVGRLEPDTCIMTAINVLEELRNQHGIETHITICGTGSLMNQLRSLSIEKNLDVRVEGWIENTQPYLEKSSICIAGGFLSILEAMSKGIPVIAIATTSLKRSYYQSVIDAGGLMSIQSSIVGLANEIQKLSDNPKMYDQIADSNREFVSKLTWEKVANLYQILWDK